MGALELLQQVSSTQIPFSRNTAMRIVENMSKKEEHDEDTCIQESLCILRLVVSLCLRSSKTSFESAGQDRRGIWSS